METPNAIYFWGQDNLHGYMSNFYPCTFTDPTDTSTPYNCSEQYFMLIKAKTFEPENTTLHAQILQEKNPKKVKSLGRRIANYDEELWSNMRYDAMLAALRLKFTQNEDLKTQLLATKPKTLYEASPNDKIWGIGFAASAARTTSPTLYGTNLLGLALTQIRDELEA
jgi:ribA/ribD-fused uncharacterized protein